MCTGRGENTRGEHGSCTQDPYPRCLMRGIALGLGIPLLAAALLWWLAGSDIGLARLISITVILLALGGWYLSRRQADD